LVRLGVSPTVVTLLGLALVIASCLLLLMTHRVLVFCVLVTAAALLDVVDGAVARAGGRVTKFGSYLDAMCDRYAEGAVVLSVAAVTGYWMLSMIVLVGALLVSYAKARAAMEVTVSNLEWPDLMERAERDVGYIVGLTASQLIAWKPLGHDLFWWTLVVLAILIHITVIQRVLRARRLIRIRG
jgi:CDP-diacylglycerol--glycerol-3-phosphate 3-phosphatidyltransferase/archaetidylinositol phosphate synthase